MEEKFIQLFTGLQRNYGEATIQQAKVNPKKGNKLEPPYFWTGRPITKQDYLDHLSGERSIGVQPCTDESTVIFGAIDIDPKHYTDYSPKKYYDIIIENNLPLVPIKSKSGGLHLYLFLEKPTPAIFVREFLEKLLMTLTLEPDNEIFPEQTELDKDPESGEPINGKFLNLPYYAKKERVAIDPRDGSEFSFDQFIKTAEANRHSKEFLEDFINLHISQLLMGGVNNKEFEDGPPCLQLMTKNSEGLKDGRDRFLYNYYVFAKKKYPDNWEDKVIKASRKYFHEDHQYSDNEIKKKLPSWKKDSRKTGYTCTKEPINQFCLRAECRKRKHGFVSSKISQFPKMENLEKIDYFPEPEYIFTAVLPSGKRKEVRVANTKIFYLQVEFFSILTQATGSYLPKLSPNEFSEVVSSLFPPKKVHPAPKGTSPQEELMEMVKKYVNGPQAKNNTAFKSGASLIEDDFAYISYGPMYDDFTSQGWKIKKDRTAQMMKTLLDAEFGIKKRFKNKKGSGSYNAVSCVKFKASDFVSDEDGVEDVKFKGIDDIY